MDYQIIFNDDAGRIITTPIMGENDKDSYIKNLGDIPYIIKEVEEKKWQLAGVVFDIQLIPAAKKAIKEKRQIKGLYTFGDPKKIAIKDTVCKVQCTTTETKIGYVVAIYSATASQIQAFKAKIGYDKLGLVVQQL